MAIPEDIKRDVNQWEMAQVYIPNMIVAGKLPEGFGIGAIKAGRVAEGGEREWTRGIISLSSLREVHGELK